MKTKPRKTKVKDPETIICKYGYEYHLVEAIRCEGTPQPNMFGMTNFALKSVNKIKNDN